MKADFEPKGSGGVRVVLVPENALERLLLATWLRYDANALSADVSRGDDKRISQVAIEASDAS